MRLRSFEARSIAAAMQLMRDALGEEAVIVTTQELANGVRLTAAVDTAADDLAALLAQGVVPPVRAALEACLAHHRTPPALAEALLAPLAASHAADPVTALGHALEARFRFLPLAPPLARPVALVGPPGVGKTAAIVRLAAQALVAGHPARVVSADLARAGGIAQLRALLEPLRLEPTTASRPEELAALVAQAAAGTSLLIDTTGINPFHGGEIAALAELLHAAKAEPVLVLPAGLDVEDSIEIASNFAAMGARWLIVTRLDAARRLGGALAVMDVGLAVAGASIGPSIGKSLPALSAAGLARVLLHRAGA